VLVDHKVTDPDKPWGVRAALVQGPGKLIFEFEQSLGSWTRAERNLPLDRYADFSCLGGLPLFSMFFDVVNSGRFRTSHFRGTNGLSPFQGTYP
jgi:hypothetical protein